MRTLTTWRVRRVGVGLHLDHLGDLCGAVELRRSSASRWCMASRPSRTASTKSAPRDRTAPAATRRDCAAASPRLPPASPCVASRSCRRLLPPRPPRTTPRASSPTEPPAPHGSCPTRSPTVLITGVENATRAARVTRRRPSTRSPRPSRAPCRTGRGRRRASSSERRSSASNGSRLGAQLVDRAAQVAQRPEHEHQRDHASAVKPSAHSTVATTSARSPALTDPPFRPRTEPPSDAAPLARSRDRKARSTRGRRSRRDRTAGRPSPGGRREGTRTPRRARGSLLLVVGVAEVRRHLTADAVAHVLPSVPDRRARRGSTSARWRGGCTACARLSCASGSPTNSTAWAAASATSSAIGSAIPMSSDGEDHHAAGDEAGVLPRLEHAGEPVQPGVDVGAPDALDERADHVVVVVACRSGAPSCRARPRRRPR